MILTDLLTPGVPLLEKTLRTLAVYVFLLVGLRLAGKREMSQINSFDLVVLLLLSNTVQNAIIGNDTSLTGGLLGAASLLAVNALLVRLYYRGPRLEHAMIEPDVLLIQDHKLREHELRKLHINVGELTARAHERGFDDLHEVETAVLYPNGTIYMRGESRDSVKLEQILRQIDALRQDVARARRGDG